MSSVDFFNRNNELRLLKEYARNGNHVLLTGQRRMGKRHHPRTWAAARERRLGGAFRRRRGRELRGGCHRRDRVRRTSDSITKWAYQRHVASGSRYRGRRRSFETSFRTEFCKPVPSWDNLIRNCANNERRILLVVDELPIFLKRLYRDDGDVKRVDEFLSWLRRALHHFGGDSPVVILTGSIGLTPFVNRLGIPDRVNDLHNFHLSPWDRVTSIACFERLAASYELQVEEGVAEAVYDSLGMGIPHHVQPFFARLKETATIENQNQVTVADVSEVHRTRLLGPAGQNDIRHNETRHADALDYENYNIAMYILADAAVQEVVNDDARCGLVRSYRPLFQDVHARIAQVLEVLVHDGYLECSPYGYRFPSSLLKNWWAARFRHHRVSLAEGQAAQ